MFSQNKSFPSCNLNLENPGKCLKNFIVYTSFEDKNQIWLLLQYLNCSYFSGLAKNDKSGIDVNITYRKLFSMSSLNYRGFQVDFQKNTYANV